MSLMKYALACLLFVSVQQNIYAFDGNSHCQGKALAKAALKNPYHFNKKASNYSANYVGVKLARAVFV